MLWVEVTDRNSTHSKIHTLGKLWHVWNFSLECLRTVILQYGPVNCKCSQNEMPQWSCFLTHSFPMLRWKRSKKEKIGWMKSHKRSHKSKTRFLIFWNKNSFYCKYFNLELNNKCFKAIRIKYIQLRMHFIKCYLWHKKASVAVERIRNPG